MLERQDAVRPNNSEVPAQAPSPFAISRRTLVLLGLTNFCGSAMLRICDPMLPALVREFAVTTGQAALCVSGYAVAFALMQLLFGPLGDRWGKRRVIGWSTLGCGLASLLALAAGTLEMLVAARIFSGAMAAGTVSLALAWIGDAVPYEQRQVVLARFLSTNLMGLIFGQWMSGLITDWLGWRWVFGVLGVLYLAVSSGLLLGAQEHRPAAGRASGPYWSKLAQVLRTPPALLLFGFTGLEGAFVFGAVAFVPAFLVTTGGLSISAASAAVALYAVGGFLYSAGAARLLSGLGERGVALAGGLSMGLAWLFLGWVNAWWAAIPAVLFGGIGYYMLHGTLMTRTSQLVPELRGTSMALFSAFMFGGVALGVAVGGVVIDRVGYATQFGICGLGLLALTAAVVRHLKRSPAQ